MHTYIHRYIHNGFGKVIIKGCSLSTCWRCVAHSAFLRDYSEKALKWIFISALSYKYITLLVTSFDLLSSCKVANKLIMKIAGENELERSFISLNYWDGDT